MNETNPYSSYLEWITSQQDVMVSRVQDWASQCTGTHHHEGVRKLACQLKEEFAPLGGEAELLEVAPHEQINDTGQRASFPLGPALRICKRSRAARRVLLCIHTDTVYDPGHPFQQLTWLDDETLQGPGVADAKGGIAVIRTALEALERSPFAEGIGWEVLLNPDEEIASPGSNPLLDESARRNHVGMVYEPCLPTGELIAARKGSGHLTLMMHGRSAHAGRDPEQGRNAIVALCEIIARVDALNGQRPDLTLNVGTVRGGDAPNRVPDFALCRVNLRVAREEDFAFVVDEVNRFAEQANQRDGYRMDLEAHLSSPPKPLTPELQCYLDEVQTVGHQLNLPVSWKSSGGVCDGNRLAAAGLPTVDTLGPRGANLHSPREFLHVPSLTERATLSALLLMRWGAGEGRWPART